MRRTPLRPDVAAALNEWLAQQAGQPTIRSFLVPTVGRFIVDALQRLVAKHVATIRLRCPSLKVKTVKPHTLRDAAPLALLHRGVDLSVIALWLGHESTEATRVRRKVQTPYPEWRAQCQLHFLARGNLQQMQLLQSLISLGVSNITAI